MKSIYKYILIFSLINIDKILSQDIHFSQLSMSPLNLNPSLAGAMHALEANLNYREQWKSVAKPYQTTVAAYSMRLSDKKNNKGYWAGGIHFFSDKAGDASIGTTQGNIVVAYHVRLNNLQTLGIGIQGGFLQRTLNGQSLSWGRQYDGKSYDPNLPSGETSIANSFIRPDAGAGMVWSYNNNTAEINVADRDRSSANVGIALYHINQPAFSYYSTSKEVLAIKYAFHGNAIINIPNSLIAFVPSFLYMRQANAQELTLGSLLRYQLSQDSKLTGYKKSSAISGGAFLRIKDAITFNVLLEYRQYALGFSYDVNISKLRAASNMRGAFEIALRYTNGVSFLYKSRKH